MDGVVYSNNKKNKRQNCTTPTERERKKIKWRVSEVTFGTHWRDCPTNKRLLPVGHQPSAASVDVLLDRANLTGDLATPFKSAMTVDAGLGRPRFVAPPAAEQLATLHSRRRAVTHTTRRTQGPSDSVRITKVWRFFRINQILSSRWLDGGHLRNDCLTVVSWNDLGSTVEFFFQPCGNVTKKR